MAKGSKFKKVREFIQTPVGEYQARLGKKMHDIMSTDNILEGAGMGEQIGLPQKAKYNPLMQALMEMSGVNPEEINEREALALGLDLMLPAGAVGAAGKLSKTASKIPSLSAGATGMKARVDPVVAEAQALRSRFRQVVLQGEKKLERGLLASQRKPPGPKSYLSDDAEVLKNIEFFKNLRGGSKHGKRNQFY